jgi:hypothetical protein
VDQQRDAPAGDPLEQRTQRIERLVPAKRRGRQRDAHAPLRQAAIDISGIWKLQRDRPPGREPIVQPADAIDMGGD